MMNLTPETRAGILVEAPPYIQEYAGQIIVVKYGGNAMVSEVLKEAVIQDIVLLNLVGIKVVLVHGGGPEISEMLKKIGKESTFVKGLRYTDEETMDIVQMILCGKVNKNLVSPSGESRRQGRRSRRDGRWPLQGCQAQGSGWNGLWVRRRDYRGK